MKFYLNSITKQPSPKIILLRRGLDTPIRNEWNKVLYKLFEGFFLLTRYKLFLNEYFIRANFIP